MNGPLFPVGFEVIVERYAGVLEAGHTLERAPSGFRPLVCVIEGVHLGAEIGEEWDEKKDESIRTVSYAKGWRYFLVRPNGAVWGWEYESTLLTKGYTPPGPLTGVVNVLIAN